MDSPHQGVPAGRGQSRGSVPLLAAAVWICGLVGFAVIAGLAAEHARFPADLWIAQHVQGFQSLSFHRALDFGESLASAPYAVFLIGAAIAGLFFFGRRREALLMVAVPLGWGLNAGCKYLVSRPRPSAFLVEVRGQAGDDPSFPSGHTVTATLLFGLLFFLTSCVRPVWWRRLLQVFCIYVIASTGLARIYDGRHWASDVYGAMLLGALVVTAAIVIYQQTSRPRGA